jgi:hypothetical protein
MHGHLEKQDKLFADIANLQSNLNRVVVEAAKVVAGSSATTDKKAAKNSSAAKPTVNVTGKKRGRPPANKPSASGTSATNIDDGDSIELLSKPPSKKKPRLSAPSTPSSSSDSDDD